MPHIIMTEMLLIHVSVDGCVHVCVCVCVSLLHMRNVSLPSEVKVSFPPSSHSPVQTPHLINVSALTLQSSSNLNFRLSLQRIRQLIIF